MFGINITPIVEIKEVELHSVGNGATIGNVCIGE